MHLVQVRYINRVYYHRNRDRIADSATTVGPARDQEKSIRKIKSFGRRVFPAIVRAKPWTHQ